MIWSWGDSGSCSYVLTLLVCFVVPKEERKRIRVGNPETCARQDCGPGAHRYFATRAGADGNGGGSERPGEGRG